MHKINELIISFAAPSNPTSFKVVSVTAITVTLQWKPPRATNGVITHYSLQYGVTVINDDFGNKTSDPITGSIKGLSPDTEYTLRLRAHTRVGAGPSADVIVKTSKLIKQLLCT